MRNLAIMLIEKYFHLQGEMKPKEREIIAKLRQWGYKLTPQRKAVLKTIMHSQNHLTPVEIYNRVKQVHPGIGLVTVYRTIGLLTELELICKMHTGDNSRSYLIRRALGHHHHLICSGCGAVVDFTACDLEELEQRLYHETGFEVEGHLLEFYGLCPDCQKIASA